MPEVLRIHGYRFFFFSREGTESRGFRSTELRELHKLFEQNRESFIILWDKHFSQ